MLRGILYAYFVIMLFFNQSVFPLSPRAELGPENRLIHLGTVIHNDQYQIYRSAYLNNIGFDIFRKHLKKHQRKFPKTIIYMNKLGYRFPIYFALQEHRLQRYYDFKFYHSFGEVRTYLDGTDPYRASEDIDSSSYLGKEARKHFSYKDDKIDGGIREFKTILELILDPNNQPVLFHCYGGLHRTGIVALALRYLQGGHWTGKRTFRRWGMDLNLAEYEYYQYNRILFRKENVLFIRQFSREPYFAKLKKRYSSLLQ